MTAHAFRWATHVPSKPRKFDFFRGDVCLGVVTLAPNECDFPWFVGYLTPNSAFGEFKPLFDKEAELSRLANDSEEYNEEAQDAADRILDDIMEPGIRFRAHHNGEWSEVLGLGIEGDRVGWR